MSDLTREEELDWLCRLRSEIYVYMPKEWLIPMNNALDMAIAALPEEGAELIDRRQIKWYGCDHEGHIKGINCDTADCSKCFFATVEHDEVMSLPVYRIPDSAENKGIHNWRCSICGQTLPAMGYVGKADFMATHFKFCPNCGADMRGKGE